MKKEHIKGKERAKFPKPMPRRMIVDALVDAYSKDCDEVLMNFPREHQVELIEHMMASLDILIEYVKTPEKEVWKQYSDLETVFLKKHKSRLGLYRQKTFYNYYWPETAIMETDIISQTEFNSLSGDEQILTEKEIDSFFNRAKTLLYKKREFILLNEDPDEEKEKEKENEKEHSELDGKDPKVSQSAQLLIIHYLLKSVGVERGSADISEIARFAHFLLGKKIGILSNSDIYKRLRKMPNIKSDKELVKDLQTIRPLFAALDLKDIVFQIDKEIGLARKERLKKSRHPED